MAAYGFYTPKKGPIRTKSISPTTASAGVTSRGKAPTPQYKERESRNTADDKIRAQVLATLKSAISPQVTGPPGGGAGPTFSMAKMPQVPVEPTAGNPYKGVEAAIGRFSQASGKRSRSDVAAARKALKGRADPGSAITGSFDAQALGMAAEQAAAGSALKYQARQGFADAELERRSTAAKNRFTARQTQIKNDVELLGGANSMLSPSQAAALEAEGIDSSQFMYNPMGGNVALGRARFARRNEASGLPPTAWAQAAQYGLQPPNTFGSSQEFYTALGQAKSGQYGGGGGDLGAFMQWANANGLLQGLDQGG